MAEERSVRQKYVQWQRGLWVLFGITCTD